jgi:hypothetical protein
MTEIIQQIPVIKRELKPYRTPDQRWEEVTTEIYGSAELPATTHYDHDPLWDKRFWAIQNIRDQSDGKRFGFWTIVWGLMISANLLWLKLI